MNLVKNTDRINHQYFGQFIIFWIVLVSSWYSQSYAGGWTSSGGGSGVICFDSENRANQFEQAMNLNRWPGPWLKSVTSVEPLDFFEAAPEVQERIKRNWTLSNNNNLIKGTNEQSWIRVHQKIQQRIKLLSPLFGLTLEALNEKMKAKEWVKKSILPLINDQFDPTENASNTGKMSLAESVKNKNPRCRLVQIIRRMSEDPNIIESSNKEKNIPEQFWRFQLEYVDSLFSKMSALGQSMLFLHEQLYLMGHAIGHPSSEVVRYWVREFTMLETKNIFIDPELKFVVAPPERFENSRPEVDGYQDIKPPAQLRSRMTYSFGDYVLFYFKEWGESKAKKMKRSNFAVFIDMLRNSRTFMHECLGSQFDQSKRSMCFQMMKTHLFDSLSMSNQEEFIYLSWLIYGSNDGMLNYEYLVTPDTDPEIRQQRAKAEFIVCRQMKADLKEKPSFTESTGILNRLRKAAEYCQSRSEQ